MKTPFRSFVALAATGALFLAGCGSDDNSEGASSADTSNIECASGTIAGAGSTFVQTLAQQWISDYVGACAEATVNYQGVGSGAGIEQLNSGTVDFAGSDVAMDEEEMNAGEARWGGPVLTIPWAAGGVAIEYNLDGVDLQLKPVTLAKIFNGSLTNWNAAEIAADNPDATLPDLPIQIVHRSDGSGTTAAFTAFLSEAAPSDWTLGTDREIDWPTGQGAKGSDGVTQAVVAAQGAISYVELSYAEQNNLGVAKIQNEAGNYTAPDAANVTQALEAATVNEDGTVALDYTADGDNAYPISTVTYVMTPKNPSDAAKATLAKSFIDYALEGGQGSAEALFYAPLPDNMVEAATATADGIGQA